MNEWMNEEVLILLCWSYCYKVTRYKELDSWSSSTLEIWKLNQRRLIRIRALINGKTGALRVLSNYITIKSPSIVNPYGRPTVQRTNWTLNQRATTYIGTWTNYEWETYARFKRRFEDRWWLKIGAGGRTVFSFLLLVLYSYIIITILNLRNQLDRGNIKKSIELNS